MRTLEFWYIDTIFSHHMISIMRVGWCFGRKMNKTIVLPEIWYGCRSFGCPIFFYSTDYRVAYIVPFIWPFLTKKEARKSIWNGGSWLFLNVIYSYYYEPVITECNWIFKYLTKINNKDYTKFS